MEEFAYAVTSLANDACRVTLVNHHQGVIFLCQVTNLIDWCHVAVHREHAISHDDAEPLRLCLLQAFLKFLHVGIGIAVALGLAQPHTIDDGGMVQGVADNGVFLCEQRFKHAAVGVEAGSIQNGVLCFEIVADGSFKFLVDVLRTADETHRRHTEATAIHHAFRGLDEPWVVAQSQVVVGTEVQHFLGCGRATTTLGSVTYYRDSSTLWATDESLFLVEPCLTNLAKSLCEMFLHFSVHSFSF